jgi:hypothetical protein
MDRFMSSESIAPQRASTGLKIQLFVPHGGSNGPQNIPAEYSQE